ncbi:thiamin-monophosphate kinase [Anaplasma centrale str. Israel]|uniref:Thiamine-monophosphate kinase n=2 Tax=Anaplasma centrale TaxID=769 RepID=D1AS58_ANACI|nr:thiamin-monophosphate kinase [Anaplasma centrale str. Israel]
MAEMRKPGALCKMQRLSTDAQNLTSSIAAKTSNIDEFACIEKYIRPLMRSGFSTENDDAGKISSPNGSFIVTQDILVEGTHFLRHSNPTLLAKKALRVNLSDLAAMGAQPYGYMLGMSLPQGVTEEWWEQFSNGLREDNKNYNVNLIGGDTTSNNTGTITISITAMGVPGMQSMTRSQAKVGDFLYVSGNIGDATLGLMAYQDLIGGEYFALKRRYDLPEPRITLGSKICGIASACIDISDGLVQDIGHICRLSNVGASIHLNQIPMSDAAQDVLRRNPELIERICSGGDDYELAFTSAESNHTKIMHIAADLGVKVTTIGVIVRQPGVEVYDGKNIVHFTSHGYSHKF